MEVIGLPIKKCAGVKTDKSSISVDKGDQDLSLTCTISYGRTRQRHIKNYLIGGYRPTGLGTPSSSSTINNLLSSALAPINVLPLSENREGLPLLAINLFNEAINV
ncbi:hypothetical protein TNCV_413211 [Trichonephila clavipes]|nr:hypothetical protein TNCV_413211 [Trichonephila clavipes]